jgi:hypothetical protein
VDTYTSPKIAHFEFDPVPERAQQPTACPSANVVPTEGLKAASFFHVVQDIGVKFRRQEPAIITFDTIPCIVDDAFFECRWARYPKQNSSKDLSRVLVDVLTESFDLENKQRSQKMSGERAQAILYETLLAREWYLQELVLSAVARTKAFFGMKPTEMKELRERLHKKEEEGIVEEVEPNEDADDDDRIDAAERDILQDILQEESTNELNSS